MAATTAARIARDRHICVLVTLDVQNAFNSIPRPLIDTVAASFGLPYYLTQLLRSYLIDRTLTIPVSGSNMEQAMNCDVPQGLVLGLTCGVCFMTLS